MLIANLKGEETPASSVKTSTVSCKQIIPSIEDDDVIIVRIVLSMMCNKYFVCMHSVMAWRCPYYRV